jgi:hypothetical protein
MLNTVYSMAQSRNMAVSMVTLSRETPFSNLHQIYGRIAQNTYLPNREQPGFDHLLDQIPPGKMTELLLFVAKELQTDKLYYLLKSYGNTDNPEVRFSLMADLQGDFIAVNQLKKIYKEIFAEKAVFSTSFVKSKHIWDYFRFINALFALFGMGGWVILFDEAENIGRLGRKSRFNAYANMSKFLLPTDGGAMSLFTITNNFAKQVIDEKDERRYVLEASGINHEAINEVLDRIEAAEELTPLAKDEFERVLKKIITFHAGAYSWTPDVSLKEMSEAIWDAGSYRHLRTKIRASIEHLDQIYQYGDAGIITAFELSKEIYTEEIPLPDEL